MWPNRFGVRKGGMGEGRQKSITYFSPLITVKSYPQPPRALSAARLPCLHPSPFFKRKSNKKRPSDLDLAFRRIRHRWG
ncbi:hypothetical protein NPIL_94761 [Nephila pilipes]|uniref:Uncharacterized protein n=1 Tax=Nephila pilipes TaxID=299642 RepID=A0A8X6QAQ7_NEPPI|nr:hypothetical protein NPIL_94761 [Nephila pilipes]